MKVRWYGRSAFLLSGSKRVFVTYQHGDHDAPEVVGGSPAVIRATGTHDSPVGRVVGVVSERDAVAGTYAARTRSSASSRGS